MLKSLERSFLINTNSMDFLKTVVDVKPPDYEPPPFPSLYWPFPVSGSQTAYLYDARPMWRFTLYWTLICVTTVHMTAAGYACIIQYRNWKVIWVVPIIYLIIGGLEALIAGNVVGGL